MKQTMDARRVDAVILHGNLTGLLTGAALSAAGLSVVIPDAAATNITGSDTWAAIQWSPQLFRIAEALGPAPAAAYAAALSEQLHALTSAPLPYIRTTDLYIHAMTEAEVPMLERQAALMTQMGIPARTAADAGGCPFPVRASLVIPRQALIDISAWMAALRASILRQGGHCSPETAGTPTSRRRTEASRRIHTAPYPPALLQRNSLLQLEHRRAFCCTLHGDYPLHNIHQTISGDLLLYPAKNGITAWMDTGTVGGRLCGLHQDVLHQRMPDWHIGPVQLLQAAYAADGLPLIGALPEARMLAAYGIGRQDALGCMHAAAILSRLLLGQALPEDARYAPDRQLPQHIVRRIYRQQALHRLWDAWHPSAPRCTFCRRHLRWQPILQRWECALCGAAFSAIGNVLAGPATQPAPINLRQRPDI